MAGSEYPLSLVIKAVDRATAPLRQINARLQKFTAPVRKLNNSFRAFAEEAGLPRLAKGFDAVRSSVKEVGTQVVAMAAAAGIALYTIVRGSIDAGDKLGEMAQRVGLSVDSYASLQHAAAQADVEQEAFNGAMDQFNKRLGEAKAGGGGLLTFLQQVSPALAQQVKHAKNTEEALGLMTWAFEKVTDPGKRAALAAAAFGKSGLQMGQFLGQGSKAIEEQRRRYFELVGSQEAYARAAGEADNAVRETELAKALTSLISGNRANIATWARQAGAALTDWVKGGGLDRLLAGLSNLKWILGAIAVVMASSFVSSVVSLGGALWQLGSAVLPVVLRAASLLWPVITGLFNAFMGINFAVAGPFLAALLSVAAAGYAIYKNWQDITEIFTTWEGALNALKTALDLIIAPLDSLKTAWDWWSKQFGFGKSAGAQPVVGAAAAAPATAPQLSSAHVQVDFKNLPPGSRVTQDPRSTAPLDLSMGYAMTNP